MILGQAPRATLDSVVTGDPHRILQLHGLTENCAADRGACSFVG